MHKSDKTSAYNNLIMFACDEFHRCHRSWSMVISIICTLINGNDSKLSSLIRKTEKGNMHQKHTSILWLRPKAFDAPLSNLKEQTWFWFFALLFFFLTGNLAVGPIYGFVHRDSWPPWDSILKYYILQHVIWYIIKGYLRLWS
jgi:hypothetical protein